MQGDHRANNKFIFMTKEHITKAIKDAEAGISGLGERALSCRGFSTATMRRLFNNLCNIDGIYLEVGLYCGATFVSSFNKDLISIGIEDYSQDFSVSSVADELKKNVEDCTFSFLPKEVHVHYTNCFTMDKSLIPEGIDILFYDGNHSEGNQAQALPTFFDKMADKFVLIVDDINWPEVQRGTTKGFEALTGKIKLENWWYLRGEETHDDPIWHNGLDIYLITKK